MDVQRTIVLGLILASSACTGTETSTPVSTPAPVTTPPPGTPSTGPTTTTPSPTTALPTTTTIGTTTTTTLVAPATTTGTTTSPASTSTTTPTAAPTTTPHQTTIAPTTTAAPTTIAPPNTSAPGSPSLAVHSVPTDAKVVALTFDAGSDLGNTGLVLDLLSEHGVAASFGITGEFAGEHPDHVRRMAREGHVVMNHSNTHSSFTGVSSDDVLLDTASRQADLRAADDVLAPLIGRSTVPFWRPPYGDYDTSVLADVGAIGYGYTVMWTVDSLGWRGLSADEITARVVDAVEPGAIVVMHVGSQSADAQALGAIIAALRDDGYRFTTVANAFAT